jgi:hypothetical protein
MTCQEFWRLMPELEGAVEHQHPRDCSACAALLRRQNALRQGLGQLAQDLKSQHAPQRVENKLIDAFRENHARPVAPARRRLPLAWGLAAAATIGFVFFVALERHSAPRLRAQPEIASAVLQTDEPEEFWPLPNAAGGVSAEDSDLVTVEVPRATLVAMGVPVADDGPGRVEAVLALDADGVVQGVRLLQ